MLNDRLIYLYCNLLIMPVQKITKEEIIQVAVRVFREKGYHNTSMNDLAKACGLTKGLFYHYFKNKNEMMREALEEVKSAFNQHVFSKAYRDDLFVGDRAKEMAESCMKIFSFDAGGCLMGNTLLETVHSVPEFKPILIGFFDDWIKAMAHIFQEKYPEEEALMLAQGAVGEIEGAIMMMQLYDDITFLMRALNKMVSMV